MAARAFRWRRPYTVILSAVGLLMLCDLFGVFRHMFELDYDTHFTYPLDSEVNFYVNLMLSGQQSPVTPLESHQFRYLIDPRERCSGQRPLRLLIAIKSAPDHVERRRVIRQTWAELRTDVRHVFLLGTRAGNYELQRTVRREVEEYNDIVQAYFQDSYYNNTLKTMSGFRWAIERCADAEHTLFVDDDMYVSVPNVLRLAAQRAEYPAPEGSTAAAAAVPQPDSPLLVGYVFPASSPHRHRFSKWFVPLQEYPFSRWPPYCTAGAYVVSRSALRRLLYTSYYTKMFRFDDIYLGLVAQKAGVKPLHTDYIHFWEQTYSPDEFRHVVAAHGFHDPSRLLAVWSEQHKLGNA
ncbi:beta-1,3-galactosyltransferase brn-like [Amphibalanus amphitrite]|uniref:beta-1,3-galactosyltransferase brn-like n=1 Tax=Amphibalanus amphitrite TaxID=1232801 RepID=UPI001C912E97|nr:beta-1,3-galactosyltransferase brn-like [Amphibalanus amphitrite]XP_043216230.1 beta-1,3-galactosyltransferase brn-like [Amphibalanus amphitrite]XP_043216231.1 beta-1,3-galactosyltransferase brn-like [Amphibalanus amphitrite]